MMWANSRWIVLYPEWLMLSYKAAPAVLYCVLGTVYFLTLRRFASLSHAVLVRGAICYLIAFPVAMFLLWLSQHKGGVDAINAVKSGFVFPIIAFGLGLPLVEEQCDQPNMDGKRD